MVQHREINHDPYTNKSVVMKTISAKLYLEWGKFATLNVIPQSLIGTAKTEDNRFVRERKKKYLPLRFIVEPTFWRSPTLDIAPLSAKVGKRCHNLKLGW